MVEALSLKVSNGVSIWLAQPQFTADEAIMGSVYLDVGQVPATNLTIFLKGVDEITVWKRHLKNNRRYFKKESKVTQFARVKLVLKNFEDKRTPSGLTSYPFQMQLPADLPPSCFCKSKVKSL